MKRFALNTDNNNSIVRIAKKNPKEESASIEHIGVSAKIAAEMLGVSVRTVWNLAKEQKIHTVRLGKRVIFSVQSLRELVDGKKL